MKCAIVAAAMMACAAAAPGGDNCKLAGMMFNTDMENGLAGWCTKDVATLKDCMGCCTVNPNSCGQMRLISAQVCADTTEYDIKKNNIAGTASDNNLAWFNANCCSPVGTTKAPTTQAPTTAGTTKAPTTQASTKAASTTKAPTAAPNTCAAVKAAAMADSSKGCVVASQMYNSKNAATAVKADLSDFKANCCLDKYTCLNFKEANLAAAGPGSASFANTQQAPAMVLFMLVGGGLVMGN